MGWEGASDPRGTKALPETQRTYDSTFRQQAVGLLFQSGRINRRRMQGGQGCQRPGQVVSAPPSGFGVGYGCAGAETVISRAFSGTAVVVVRPPGQRTSTSTGVVGVPSTATALSCDQ